MDVAAEMAGLIHQVLEAYGGREIPLATVIGVLELVKADILEWQSNGK